MKALLRIMTGCLLAGSALGAGLSFQPGAVGEYTFDTGTLRGTLRSEGKSKGLSGVVHVPTGARLDASMGLLGHYRVFTANKRYGPAAWDWPSRSRLEPDGSVEVTWPAAEDRPFELRARYRLADTNAVEVSTTVTAAAPLSGFESFLACYFEKSFTNSLLYVKDDPNAPGRFLAAEERLGTWLAAPRDEAAAKLIKDGRWTIPPNPVDWVLLPPLSLPLGLRRAPHRGLTAVLMARPEDAFALLTPFQTEAHYSLYASLLGKDLVPGQAVRARVRLVIDTGLSDAAAVKYYGDWTREPAR